MGVFEDDSPLAEIGQGGAERGRAHGAEFAQLGAGDGMIQAGEGLRDALGGSWLGVGRSGAGLVVLVVIGRAEFKGERVVLLEKFERDVIA